MFLIHHIPGTSFHGHQSYIKWPCFGAALVKVAKAIGVANYNILQNNGLLAHQEVMHVHWHVIPKTNSEGLGLRWQAHSADHASLAANAASLKSRI